MQVRGLGTRHRRPAAPLDGAAQTATRTDCACALRAPLPPPGRTYTVLRRRRVIRGVDGTPSTADHSIPLSARAPVGATDAPHARAFRDTGRIEPPRARARASSTAGHSRGAEHGGGTGIEREIVPAVSLHDCIKYPGTVSPSMFVDASSPTSRVVSSLIAVGPAPAFKSGRPDEAERQNILVRYQRTQIREAGIR